MKRILLLSMLLSLLSGCAFTRDQIPLNYYMNAHITPSFTSRPAETITIGNFQDRRGMDDPRVIFHKRNLNGDTVSGVYEAEKPVASIVEDAVRQALAGANFNVLPGQADYLLYGVLLDLRYEIIVGFWQGDFKPVITVQLYMKDTRSGKVVWNETFMGRGSGKSSGIVGESLIRTSLNSALDDLARQVAGSESLRGVFASGPK